MSIDIDTIVKKYNLESPSATSTTQELSAREIEEILLNRSIKKGLESSHSHHSINHVPSSSTETLQEQIKTLTSQLQQARESALNKEKEFEIERRNWQWQTQQLKKKYKGKIVGLQQLLAVERQKHTNSAQALRKSPSINDRSFSKKRRPRSKAKPTKPRSRPSSSSSRSLKIPSYLKKKTPSEIERLEKDIERLNSEYRKLLASSHDRTSDFKALRMKIDQFSDEITQKSRELFELKKKHQETLRKGM